MNTYAKSLRPVFNTYPSLLDSFLNDFTKTKESIFPAVNIAETNDAFILELAVPGIKRDTIKVNIDNNMLIISNVTDETAEERNENFKRVEFNYSSFERSFRLPKSVDTDKIEATYDDGVLHLNLPKREEAKPKEPRLIEVT
jgi:HSP20 family protein